MTKDLMIKQGYVPSTCLIEDPIARLLLWDEINKGRDPCEGCNVGQDRVICKGRPKKDTQ